MVTRLYYLVNERIKPSLMNPNLKAAIGNLCIVKEDFHYVVSGIINEEDYFLLKNEKSNKLSLILKAVSLEENVPMKAIKSTSRKREPTEARHIFCYIASILTEIHPLIIGKAVNRDRTTVAFSVKNVKNIKELKHRANNLIEKYGLINTIGIPDAETDAR